MIKQLYEIANECIEEMQENKRLIMTLEDGRRHDNDNICHIYNEEIVSLFKSQYSKQQEFEIYCRRKWIYPGQEINPDNLLAFQILETFVSIVNIDQILKLSDFEKIKTNNDFDNLVSAFGTRTLNCGTGNPFCTDFTGNLIECLIDELDEDEIAEVNDILRRNRISRSI